MSDFAAASVGAFWPQSHSQFQSRVVWALLWLRTGCDCDRPGQTWLQGSCCRNPRHSQSSARGGTSRNRTEAKPTVAARISASSSCRRLLAQTDKYPSPLTPPHSQLQRFVMGTGHYPWSWAALLRQHSYTLWAFFPCRGWQFLSAGDRTAFPRSTGRRERWGVLSSTCSLLTLLMHTPMTGRGANIEIAWEG